MKFKKINISRLFSAGDGACREKNCAVRCDVCGACKDCARRNGGGISHSQSASPSCKGYYGAEPTVPEMRDRGNEPIVFDIRKEAFMTPDFRTALWTGENLQLTVMTLFFGRTLLTKASRTEPKQSLP